PPSPVVEPSGGNGFVGVTNRTAGVKTRSVEVDGHTDTWTYDSQGLPGPRVSVTSVTEPVTQTRTSNYFSICDNCNAPPAVPAEYGLPIYRLATSPVVTSSAQGPY